MSLVTISYANLNADELQGTTVADYLVSVVADIRILDGDLIVFEEPSFPVLELARSLQWWLADADESDFQLESFSYEEVGVVAISKGDSGWSFSSCFTPDNVSSPMQQSELFEVVESFIASVRHDVARLGVRWADIIEARA